MATTAFNGGDRFPLAVGQVLGALHYLGSALLGSKLEAQVELISSNGFCGMTDTLGATKSLRGITPQKTRPDYPTAGAGVGVRVYSERGKRIGPVFSSVEKAQDYLTEIVE